MKKALKTIKILLLALMVFSCATSSNAYRQIDFAVGQADFSAALDNLVQGQSGRRVIYPQNNSISLFLDKGLLEHYAGNYAASSEDLQNAERLIEEAYTKSISEGFLSYILNDNVKQYPGEDFEDIYLNIFNALNYYNRGNLEGALVEIRKLSMPNGKLDMLARRHEYIDPDTGANLNEMVQRETGISQLPETKSVNFSNSALARFLGALFYQANGNTDSARIEFDQLHRAFRTNTGIYYNQVPKAVDEARNVPDRMGRLNVISFTGLSPIKEEQHILHFLPFQHPILAIASLKLPVLVSRQSAINRIEVVVEGIGSFDMELLEDMGAVIIETFAARFSSIFLKTYIRTIIKYVVADAVAYETARNQGALSGLMVALAARAAMDASESADIRMSRFLPDKAYIGGINLDPGTYSVIINYYHGSRLISQDIHTDVVVNRRSLNLLQSVNLR
ncbi:MAG: hypothetical protein FWD40_02190 [Treponema sp.]|nr:hypothetical protein [Treponema sp.]